MAYPYAIQRRKIHFTLSGHNARAMCHSGDPSANADSKHAKRGVGWSKDASEEAYDGPILVATHRDGSGPVVSVTHKNRAPPPPPVLGPTPEELEELRQQAEAAGACKCMYTYHRAERCHFRNTSWIARRTCKKGAPAKSHCESLGTIRIHKEEAAAAGCAEAKKQHCRHEEAAAAERAAVEAAAKPKKGGKPNSGRGSKDKEATDKKKKEGPIQVGVSGNVGMGGGLQLRRQRVRSRGRRELEFVGRRKAAAAELKGMHQGACHPCCWSHAVRGQTRERLQTVVCLCLLRVCVFVSCLSQTASHTHLRFFTPTTSPPRKCPPTHTGPHLSTHSYSTHTHIIKSDFNHASLHIATPLQTPPESPAAPPPEPPPPPPPAEDPILAVTVEAVSGASLELTTEGVVLVKPPPGPRSLGSHPRTHSRSRPLGTQAHAYVCSTTAEQAALQRHAASCLGCAVKHAYRLCYLQARLLFMHAIFTCQRSSAHACALMFQGRGCPWGICSWWRPCSVHTSATNLASGHCTGSPGRCVCVCVFVSNLVT
eukprot:scaffold46813_cov38-Tisochrysis_lutea.AAC.4